MKQNFEISMIDKIISEMSLMDDDLFGLVFDRNIPATELLLTVILRRKDIKVISVIGQRELRSPVIGGRDVRLDILAIDEKGYYYNIEVQKQSKGANPKRARFHSAMLDSRMLKKGQQFTDLRESYVIFITEKDYFHRGLPLYTVNRHFEEIDEIFEDGSHILYVNGSYRGKDEFGQLMQDFQCRKPDDIQNEELSKSVKYFKIREGGRRVMNEALERYAELRAIQTAIETSLELNADKDKIIDILMKKFDLTREQAEDTFEEFAPVTV